MDIEDTFYTDNQNVKARKARNKSFAPYNPLTYFHKNSSSEIMLHAKFDRFFSFLLGPIPSPRMIKIFWKQ